MAPFSWYVLRTECTSAVYKTAHAGPFVALCLCIVGRWLLKLLGTFLQVGLVLALACGMLLGLVTALGLALLVDMLSQSIEESLHQQAQAEVLQWDVAVVYQVQLPAVTLLDA